MHRDFDLQRVLKETRVDAILLTRPTTVRWVTGFAGSNALVFMGGRGDITLVTDPRYAEAAGKLKNVNVRVARRESLASALKRELGSSIRRIGFQADHVSAAAAEQLRSTLSPTQLVPLTGVFSRQIASKSAAEIASITKAQQATDAAFKEVMAIITSLV